MSILDEVTVEENTTRCSICLFIASQPERDEWNAVMTDPARRALPIFRVLGRHGFAGGSKQLYMHRKKGHIA